MKFYINILAIFILSTSILYSQKKKKKALKEAQTSLIYNELNWRNIGPFRGGRSVASAGVI